ncbi:FtsX-like permease family protein [Nocardiopsis potens]|uniref:FtsX-like permease family protein n=1 Tax=Nocardiopsis potens TaxID=1246458 RepID=UPI000373D0CD|nr:FtsX-like permease family protein [Nocardiopsis potens]
MAESDHDTSPPRREGTVAALALKSARGGIGGLVAVAVAVLGGALLVTAGGVLAETGLRSHPPAERLPAADVLVTGERWLAQEEDFDVALPERAGVPDSLAARLGALPEAAAAVGDVGFPAAVDAPGGPVSAADPRTAGRAWSAVPFSPRARVEGAPPQGAREAALDAATARAAGAAVGDEVRISAAGRTARYRVSAVVDGAGTGVFFADGEAAALGGRDSGPRAGTADLVALRAAPGVSADELAGAVRAELGGADGLEVAAGAERGDAESPAGGAARTTLVAIAASGGGVVLIVVGFTVAGALSVSIAGRRRELALLRAVGATPRQVRRIAVVPAVAAAAAALPFGAAAGYPAADGMRGLLAGLGAVPAGLPLAAGPLPALAAAVLLLATVWAAASAVSGRPAKAAPAGALAESEAEPRAPRPWRARAGGALLLASAGMAVTPLLLGGSEEGVIGTATGSLVGVVGIALAGPAAIRAASGAAARLLPARTSPLTWLAVRNLHGYAYRSAGAVSALAMAVAFVLAQVYANTTLLQAGAEQRAAGTPSGIELTAPAAGGVPEGLEAEAAGVPGVAAAATATPTTAIWRSREFGSDREALTELPATVLGPGASGVIDPGVTEGDLGRLTGDAVALGASFARFHGIGAGDRVSFHLGDGAEVEAEVVAVYRRELGFGRMLVSRDLAAGHITGDLDASLLVRAEDGGAGRAREALERAAAGHPGVRVGGADAAGAPAGGVQANTAVNFAVLGALLGYVLLSVANRLAAQTLQRGPELAALRSIGMTPGQARSLLRREAAMLAAAAVAAGLLAAAAPLALAGIGFLGRPWPGGPPWVPLAAAAVVAVLTWLCTELPGRRLLTGADRRGARLRRSRG